MTTTAVVEGLKMEIEPIREVSEIIQADGESLKLLGSCRMFLKSDNLGGRRMIDCAVIDRGKSKETLISIDYLKKRNVRHQIFPNESINDYIERKYLINRYSAYYTCLSNQMESTLYQESRAIREPSKQCKQLREDMMKKWDKCFKEVLSKNYRMDPPSKD